MPATTVPHSEPLRSAKALTALPRMVSAHAETGRVSRVPPSRPASATLGQPPSIVTAAQAVTPSAGIDLARSPVQVFGVNVPGTTYLPTRRDAARVAEVVAETATAAGSRTVDVVGSAVSTVGGTLSSVGNSLADTVGWR